MRANGPTLLMILGLFVMMIGLLMLVIQDWR